MAPPDNDDDDRSRDRRTRAHPPPCPSSSPPLLAPASFPSLSLPFPGAPCPCSKAPNKKRPPVDWMTSSGGQTSVRWSAWSDLTTLPCVRWLDLKHAPGQGTEGQMSDHSHKTNHSSTKTAHAHPTPTRTDRAPHHAPNKRQTPGGTRETRKRQRGQHGAGCPPADSRLTPF